MPNVNLTDSRKRDAVVKAEATGVSEELRYVDTGGHNAYTRKILKATVDHDYATLADRYGDDQEKLGLALVDGDPEVDMEKCGVYLWGVSKVYVNSEDGIVYRIEQTEVVRDPEGNIKEKRPRQRSEANVDMEVPLTWTGRKIAKSEAVRRFVFSSKLQIVHINGLTYDFLFGMASELAETNSLMMIGGGRKGRDPLIFRSGSIPYRGFLEGRVDGNKYILLLHLSNMELKQVAEQEEESTSAETEEPKKAASKKAASKKAAAKKSAAKEVAPRKVADTTSEVLDKKADKVDDEPAIAKPATDKKSANVADKDSDSVVAEPVAEVASKATKKKKPASKKAAAKKKAKAKTPATKDKQPKAAEEAQSAPVVTKAQQEQVNNQDLGVWLKSIRMGKYLELFVENEIDVDVLSELTDDDLKELKIPLGSRRRLLKAVSEADDLRAEVVMAVQTMSGTKATSKK